jgi:hypothetical protein
VSPASGRSPDEDGTRDYVGTLHLAQMRRDPRKRHVTLMQMSIEMYYSAAVPINHSHKLSMRLMSCVSWRLVNTRLLIFVLSICFSMRFFIRPSLSPRESTVAPDANRASYHAPCKPQKESEVPPA